MRIVLLLLVLALALFIPTRYVAQSTALTVVLSVSDDQRFDTLADMPLLLSRLAPDGVTFTRAFATTPLCGPARGSLLTGLYARHHLVTCNDASAATFRTSGYDATTVARWLHDAGWLTVLYGKYLNGYPLIAPYQPAGWDEWHALASKSGYRNYSLAENGVLNSYLDGRYSTTHFAQLASALIDRTDVSQPLFIYFAPFAPHAPATVEFASDKTPFASDSVHRPLSYNEADVSDKPLWVKSLPLMTVAKKESLDAFRIRQRGTLQSYDRGLATIIDRLKAVGRWDRTLFIHIGDNGFSWGEHRWKGKNCVYEECVRIPLIVRIPGTARRTETAVVANIDIAPTIADYAAVAPSYPVNGVSFLPLLVGGTFGRDDVMFEVYSEPGGPANRFTAVRTSADDVYAEYAGGAREYYDLMIDPFQLRNAVRDAENAARVAELAARLAVLRQQ